MWMFLLLWTLILQGISGQAFQRNNKYVTTLINAKWQNTPFVLEVAEYLNDENPNYFWKFVDEVSGRSSDFKRACGYQLC